MSTGILIVEDSLTQAEQLRFLLEENGFSVRVARDGAEALALARERRPDLVISDVIMPRMDGFSLCRIMRADPLLRGIPVVLLTSYASVSNIVRGLECGAHNFLQKPYDEDYLIQRVRLLIDKLDQAGEAIPDGGIRLQVGEGGEVFDGSREQILDLLVSTYEQAVRMNAELERQRDALTKWQASLAAVHEVVIAINGARSSHEVNEITAEKLLGFPGVEGVRIETFDPASVVEQRTNQDAVPAGGTVWTSGFPLQLGARRIGLITIAFQADFELDWNNRMLLGDVCHQLSIAVARLTLLESLDQRVFERTQELEKEVRDRIRSEQQLSSSEQRYRLLFERNLAGIVQSSMDGTVLDCNPAFVRMAGYEDAVELRGSSITRCWSRPEEYGELVHRLLREKEISSVGVDLRRQDGSCCPVLANASLAEVEGSAPVIEMTLVDLTEYKSLQAQLQQAQKMESLGLLAGGIAHDFNNVLAVIMAYSEALRETLEDEVDCRSKLDGIFSATQRASDLTRQLMTFSRRQAMDPRPIDLNQIVARDLPLFKRLVGGRIEILQMPGNDLPLVQGDPSQIDQVLLNLVVNARDAMPEGGTISLRTRAVAADGASLPRPARTAASHYVVIEVEDTGCGMEPAVANRIFDPFFTTKGERGTGLGLSTVHGIVTQSGGFIQVDSQVGKGTRFSIYLPGLPEPERIPEAGSLPRSFQIVLVEDEPDLREMMTECLRWKGYDVHSCCQAEEALDYCRTVSNPVHVLITDVQLPGMDGFALVNEVHRLRPEVGALLVSGDQHATAERLTRGLRYGFLPKPFDTRALLEALKKVAGGANRTDAAAG